MQQRHKQQHQPVCNARRLGEAGLAVLPAELQSELLSASQEELPESSHLLLLPCFTRRALVIQQLLSAWRFYQIIRVTATTRALWHCWKGERRLMRLLVQLAVLSVSGDKRVPRQSCLCRLQESRKPSSHVSGCPTRVYHLHQIALVYWAAAFLVARGRNFLRPCLSWILRWHSGLLCKKTLRR